MGKVASIHFFSGQPSVSARENGVILHPPPAGARQTVQFFCCGARWQGGYLTTDGVRYADCGQRVAWGPRRLGPLLDSVRPDAVVTVHATPATAMSALLAEGRRTPPHTTVVTDFVAHSQWIARHIDCYCVAADEVKHEFIARGIPAQRIVVTGMPVRAEFAEPEDPAAARAALGLGARVPVVLAMAGSRGSFGRLPDVGRALDALERPLHGLLVAGHDTSLR